MIHVCTAGDGNVTNLGAILFAKKMEHFPGLNRKAMRVVHYKGRGRFETMREQIGGKGYASGFEGLIGFIMALVPTNEVIEQALRRTVIIQTEIFQLPAPLFEVPEGFTRIVPFAHRSLEEMTKLDRVRASYLLACLQYVQRKNMTNKSLREGLALRNTRALWCHELSTPLSRQGL